jgi:hypothetical protein
MRQSFPHRRRRGGTTRTGRDRPHGIALAESLEPRTLLATFTVGNTNDFGAGSLRQAILDANNLPGQDTIGFDASFSAGPHTISLLTALPQMSDKLAVVGPGASLLTVRRSSSVMPIFAVFNSTATVLSLSGMTVTGGDPGGNGGGLTSTGPGGPNVTLDAMVFTGNTSGGLGGAVYFNNNTAATIRNCVFTGNTAIYGGGVYFFQGGTLVMENTTISGNSATGTTTEGAGGLYFSGSASTNVAGFTPGTLVIRNSTISDNHSARAGGGVMLDTFTGTLLVQNSTFSGNTAATLGGGIAGSAGSGTITLQNTTVVGNSVSGTAAGNGGGGIGRTSTVANALNVVNSVVSQNTSAATGPDIRVDPFTTTTANNSAIGASGGFTLAAGSSNNLAFGVNPMIGALANNGGPTQTRALLSGSPLINAGSNARVPPELTTDQRGFARIVGSSVDIGAVEREAVAPTVTSAQFTFLTPPQSLRFTFSQNVGPSLGVSDLELKNLTTNTTVPGANLAMSYDTSANAATFTFTGYPNGALPDGNYRARIIASGVSSTSGGTMAADYLFDFFILAGDANRDRKVDFNDLVVLAQNYNTSGRNFALGNFNYDPAGKVDFEDLVLLAQRYNTSLPAAAPSAVADAASAPVVASIGQRTAPAKARRPTLQSVFSRG